MSAKGELFCCHMSASTGERVGLIFFPCSGYRLKSDPSMTQCNEL